MSLPPAVSRYLYQLDKRFRQAICFALDPDFRIEDWWGDVEKISNASVEVGQDARKILPVLHGMNLAESATLEFVNLSADLVYHVHIFQEGSQYYVLLVPASDERSRRQDIQQIANEVRLLNARQQRLLEELEQARAELEVKRQEANRASMVKSRFIAGMSHEFRTPLSSVIGYTELLASDASDNSDVAAHASAIGRSARHLLSMVNNILDQSRIEEGNVAIRIAPLNIRQLMDDITAMLAPLAAEKILGFAAFVEPSVPRLIQTDEVRLRQILVNLAGNAVKFTDQGEVKLELSWADDELVILISDTGPGIPQDQQDKIFDAFHRVNERDGKRGTGLGLNITARLIDLLEGSISLESEAGSGSCFRVCLKAPVFEEDTAPSAAVIPGENRIKTKSRNQRILVAEDDPDLIELLSLFLGRGGYQLIVAGDGQEAVSTAMKEQPDLVLMDVNMPNLDGLSAARLLRTKGFTAPILALTASLSASDRDQAFSWGCDGYLVKPISMPELLSAVDRYLGEAETS